MSVYYQSDTKDGNSKSGSAFQITQIIVFLKLLQMQAKKLLTKPVMNMRNSSDTGTKQKPIQILEYSK